MSRRTLTIRLVVVFGILFGSYVALCRYDLPVPEQWQQIHPGQHRDDVLAQLPELKTASLLDMKQFDQTRRSFDSPVFGHVSQFLLVDYDTWRPEAARVIRIRVSTVTEHFRFFRNERYMPKGNSRATFLPPHAVGAAS